jgi:predicted transcriptional regulator of viral defense system
MINKREVPSDLSGWVDAKQSRGVYFFIRDEALRELKMTETAFRKSVSRLGDKGRVVRIRSGFYSIVPLEYEASGMVPPEWFIEDLMAHIGQPYYVGLLSAAVLHGAAHQQPQQFHVVTTKALREIRTGTLAIRFFVKKKLEATPLSRVKVHTGYVAISTPEATALDVVGYSRFIGGLDRTFTVLQELAESLNPTQLVKAARADGNLAFAQRLGWLLDKAGYAKLTDALARWINEKRPFAVKLDPSLPVKGATLNNRWRLMVNTDVEGDL